MAKETAPTSDEAKDARRWKKELQLAKKREKDWLAESDKIYKRYRGEEKKRNKFNVLWSNTDLLRPAIYNSRPNPDVRRRFRDVDLVGKAVSEVLERSLSIFVDGDETDDTLKNDVLDGLLSGRGQSRIRYIPKITTVPPKALPTDEGGDASDDGDPAIADTAKPKLTDQAPDEEELESESVICEHVDWKDFRHGFGRTWPEVPWVAFRHSLSRPDAEEKFGKDKLSTVEFTVPEVDDSKTASEQVGETPKVAEFWEIWDKLGERVFFVHDSLNFLLFPIDNEEGEPPLEFDGFFPCPRPLFIIENSSSLLPIPPFRLYEDQANQLDKISARIDKIVNTMRLRGAYDARIPEMADILSSDDNEMVPIQNAQQWSDGGLDKAVTWMPVEKNAQILEALYIARDKQKAVIDELIGIADIMRGATDPSETLGAQELKQTNGSGRLQRMQKEVQRYAKDLLRLAADAMAQKFSQQTFETMTELKFPTAQQKQMMIQMFQAQQQRAMMPPLSPPPAGANGMGPGPTPGPSPQAPQSQAAAPPPPPSMGGPPPPPAAAPPGPPIDPTLLQVPTWEDILGVMRSDKRRQYKIDVETDSTIANNLSSDMAGLSQVLKAVAETMTELAPMVESGVLPVDSAKELIMAVIRRSRLGLAVEDAFDKMQGPKAPPPNAHDTQMAKTQAEGQVDMAVAKMKQQGEQALQAQREQAENNRLMLEEHFKTQREQFLEQQKTQRDEMSAKFDAFVKIIVATISATKAPDPAVQGVADRTVAGGGGLQ